MNRIEIENVLAKDRAWLLDTYAALSPDDLTRGATPSEHDASKMWSARDHLVHLAGIERAFNAMIRRHLAGDANPVALVAKPDGTRRPMEEIIAEVHAMNDRWLAEHGAGDLHATVALGQMIRGETLTLLSELSDAQLEEKLPGAPWADGTIGGVISANAGHGRMHWQWVKAGLAGS